MRERNQYLEIDGLYWESETHEWFHDKINTHYTQTDNGLHKDALPNLYCFVIRNKENGEYGRAIMDSNANELIYGTKSLEDLAFFIDKLKVQKRFK